MKMKNKTEVAAVLYVILGALVDAKPTHLGGMPNSHLYAQLMDRYDLESWMTIIQFIKDQGLATESMHLLKITPKGEELSKQLNAAFEKTPAEK